MNAQFVHMCKYIARGRPVPRTHATAIASGEIDETSSAACAGRTPAAPDGAGCPDGSHPLVGMIEKGGDAAVRSHRTHAARLARR